MDSDSLDYARKLIEKADKLFELAERLNPNDPGYNGWGAAAFAFVFLGLLGMGIAYLKDRRNERSREAERTDYLARLEKLELQREEERKQRREDDLAEQKQWREDNLRQRREDLANLEKYHKEDARTKAEVRRNLKEFVGDGFDKLFGATSTAFDEIITATKASEAKYGTLLDAVGRLEKKFNDIEDRIQGR